MFRLTIVAFCFILPTRLVLTQNCGTHIAVGCFCYSFSATAITNTAAITQCANEGANCRLPFFPTTQDMNDLSNYVSTHGLPAMWAGYWNPNPHTRTAPGIWTDKLLNPAPFNNWAWPQPDDGAAVGGSGCVESYASGTWNDLPCGWTRPVACQCHWTQCPSLFTGTTGTYPAGPYMSCTTHTYTCNTNYIVDQRNVISETYTCLSTGAWNKTFVPCIITCPILANSENVFVTGGTSANLLNRPVFGTVATFTCAVGWTLQGPTNSTCQSSGTWSNGLPYCNRTGSLCDDIFNTTTGMISASGSYTLGTQYNFTCNANMLVWPDNTIATTYKCLLNTTWDQNFKPCTATCPPVTTLPNGIVSQDTIPNVLGRPIVGSVLKFICNSGYLQVGSTNSTCNSDGTWSDPIPTCTRLTCPDIFTSASSTGSTTSSVFLSNSIYTFTCNSLYCLPHYNKIAQDYMCQSNGTWNIAFEPCVPVCPEILTLSNGKATGGGQNTVATGGVVSGTQVAFSCNLGFSLVGVTSSTCNPDGQWSDPIPSCTDTQCPWIFDKSGEIDSDVFLPGHNYYFTCGQNSFVKGSLESGMEYYCDETGNWQPQFTSCSPVCQTFVGFSHGQVAYQNSFGSELNFAGSLATFSCDVGYRLNGSAQLSCNQSGKWSDQMPKCTVALCNDIWTGTKGIWTPQPTFYSLQSVTYECPVNSVADNQANLNLQCDITGRWNRPLANCLKTCKVPDFAIDNGRIQFPILNRVIFGDRVMQNATIIVSCNDGFSVSQPSMIVCSSNGIWTAPIPHCFRDSNSSWWWPIILALVLLLTFLFGISLIVWMKGDNRKSQNPYANPVKIFHPYYS